MGHFLIKLRDLILLVLLAIPGTVACQTDPALPTLPQLAPATKYVKLDQTITRLLADYHYRQAKLDDAQSTLILDAYLQALDSNRSYFLNSDIDGFNKKYRTTLDDALLAGNLQPAYDIFNAYERRLVERTNWIINQLRYGNFDFNIDETAQLERKNAPWAGSAAELDEIWRKRLKNELLTLMLAGKETPPPKEALLKRYEARLRGVAQYTSEDAFQLYMNAVSRSFDPHTAYFSPRNFENFNIQMRLSLEGIGTVLRMEDERVTVVELVPGGPADLSGQIKPGDYIIGVGQGEKGPIVDVIGWRLDDIVDLIRGSRNTVVRLQVVSAKAGPSAPPKSLRLVRSTVKLDKQAAKQEIKTFPLAGRQAKIGIISIPMFYSDFAAAQRGDRDYRSTTRDVRRLLQELKQAKVDGIVLDLRQNGGGSLQEAVELTGLFIPEGPVVQVRNSGGGVEVETDPDPNLLYDGPLAVLVDHFSASASEIFAGAIQDYGRGIVIGDPTFGKGTVQTLIDLSRFLPTVKEPVGQLKLTVAKFYRINGSSTQNRGVIPDIALPSAFDPREVGESAQEFALPWDEIKPVPYAGSQRLAGLLPELEQRHKLRIAASPAFTVLQEDIEASKEAREKTAVSLLKRKREAEWGQTMTKQREMENQRRAALGLPPLRTDEALPDEEQTPTDNTKQPDLLLDESARILVDLIDLLDKHGGQKALVMNIGNPASASEH